MSHHTVNDYFQVIVLRNGQVNWQSAQLPGDFLVTSSQGNGRLAVTLEENPNRPARLRFGTDKVKSDSPRSKSDALSWRSESSSPKTASGSPSSSPLPVSRSMLNVRAVKEGVTISIPTSNHLPNETRSAPTSPMSAVPSPNEIASPLLQTEASPSEKREMTEIEGSMSTLNVTVDPSPTFSSGFPSVSSASTSPSDSPSDAWRSLLTPRSKQRAVVARMCQEWEKSGGCKRGVKCTFAHFNPASMQPFQYCLDCQRCDFKDQTEYDAHMESKEHINAHTQKSQSRAQHSILRLKAEGSRKRCDYVDSPGGCKKGNRCPFSHMPLPIWLANQQALSINGSPTNLIFVSPSSQ